MKKLMVLVMFVMFLAGCSTFQLGEYTPSGVCVDSDDSVILKYTDNNPTTLDAALLTVNFGALEKEVYTAEQATEVLDDIEGVLTDGVSYLDFYQYLSTKVAAASVIILGDSVDGIAQTGADGLISECDKQLILIHIEKQRQIVALY